MTAVLIIENSSERLLELYLVDSVSSEYPRQIED